MALIQKQNIFISHSLSIFFFLIQRHILFDLNQFLMDEMIEKVGEKKKKVNIFQMEPSEESTQKAASVQI